MFLFVGLISGPGSVGAGLTACSIPGMKLHVESSRQSELHNASKSSWKTFSVTSRRQNFIPLPRRDVILTLLCHVATCTVTLRRQTVKLSVTSRRGILTSRRHFPTSRRHLVRLSATSRRCPARRDVAKLSSLSSRDVAPHVATWPCF